MTDAEIINLIDEKTTAVNNRLTAYMNITDLAIDSINENLNTLITTDTFNALKSIVDRLQEIITGLSQNVNDLVTNKVTNFTDLKDVQLSNLAANDLLRWNGTRWVNVKSTSLVTTTTWDSLQGKPSTFPSDWNTMINKPDIGGGGDTPSGTISWNDITNKPSTFPPAVHNHDTLYIKRTGDTVTGTFSFTGPFTVSNGNNTVTVEADKFKSLKAVISSEDVVAYQTGNNTGGGSSGGGTGVTSLAQLSDVYILAPSNGQGLVYEASLGKWVNKAVQTGSTPGTTTVRWSDISGKPSYLSDGTLDQLLAIDFDATFLKKTGDTATGLITFDAGITVRNGNTVFKVSNNGLIEITGSAKASGDLIAYTAA